MDYKVMVLDAYLLDVPDGFETPKEGEEKIRYENEHKLTVAWKKLTKGKIKSFGESFQNLQMAGNAKKGEVKILEEMSRTVDNNKQHLIHSVFIGDDDKVGNWIFFEIVGEDVYNISVEYDYEDQKAQDMSAKIVHSIEKWRH